MWQLLTLIILLGLMIGLEAFNIGPVEDFLGEAPPFTPKSLAATGFIVLAAFTTGELFKRFKIPALLGYIGAGIIFGPQLIQIAYQLIDANFPSTSMTLFHGHEPKALFSGKVIEDLALINVLTVGVIGTMGGGELKISDIKESWRVILAVIGLIVISAIPLSLATVMVIPYLPETISNTLAPFLAGQSSSSALAAALLFAILAVAMSPAATLAIIQETRARGKFTSLALGIVVVADLTLVALFLVGFNVSKLLVAPDGFSTAKLIEALPGIGMEFAWALVVGSITGVIFILYMRYVRKEMMLFTVAIIFATSFVCKVLHAETLLAFLTAGFIVQNFSKLGHDLIHELEKISTPVFIIYFMTQAALLDLKGVIAYLPLTLLLGAVRAISYYGSVRIATNALQSDEKTQRWLWISFFSRGGVDLVLADMVVKATYANGTPIFEWGTDFQTVVMATVVVHIIAGPPALKVALGGAKETEEARNASADTAEDGGGSEQAPTLGEVEFPLPTFQDHDLNERLLEMRDQLMSLNQELIEAPLDKRRRRIEESVSTIRADIDTSLEKLEELLNGDRYDDHAALKRAINTHYTQSRRKLQQSIQLWERLDPLAFETKHVAELLGRLQQIEDFDNQYVVELEQELLDVSSATSKRERLLRRGRAIQTSMTGLGRRTVPTGRLWRFYIELSVPRYLARAASSTAEPHEHFWYELGRYLRRFDTIFEQTLTQLDLPAEAQATEAPQGLSDEHKHHDEQDEHHEEHQDEHGEHGEHEPADPFSLAQVITELDMTIDPRERALAFVQAARARHEGNATEVIKHLNSWLTAATQGYEWSIQQAYTNLLDAAKCAGTLELPAVKYRASTKFDDARRAENQLQQRLTREADIVSAYVGWIVLDHQLALFSHWFGHYQQRIVDTLDTLFHEQSLSQIQKIESQCTNKLEEIAQLDEDDALPTLDEWRVWLTTQMHPTVRQTKRSLDRALSSFGQGVISRRLIDALEYRVAGFSETLDLLVQDPHTTQPSTANLETVDIKIRQWFSNRLVSEIALRYIEFNERIERILRRSLVGLDSFNQVLEYNLLVAPNEPSAANTNTEARDTLPRDTVISLLRRAEKLSRQLHDNMSVDVVELSRWIVEETTQLEARVTTPFLEHRLSDIQRDLLRSSATTKNLPQRSLNVIAVKERVSGLYSSLTPLYEELVEDVRHILSDEPRPVQRTRIREVLEVSARHDDTSLPPMYKRLFNPVPLDLPEFYVERPALEQQCLAAITEWGNGQRASILLYGDRGVGKRTLVHNLVPIKIYDLAPVFQTTPIQTIRLAEDIQTEVELCQQFSSLFPNSQPPTLLTGLTRGLKAIEERQIVIVENANKCYQRTVRGMKLCRDFLNMLNATSDKILWIVLLDTPAATLLDTMLDLYDYFSHSFELEPFTPDQIEEMIQNRHRVSGFDLEYEAPELRILYKTRHPFAAREAQKNPQRDFFRRLSEASHGNPLLALLYWMRAVSPDMTDDTLLHVAPMEHNRPNLVESLTLRKRLTLAILLQHGSLTPQQLAMIMAESPTNIQTEIEHLVRLGFIEVTVGTGQNYHLRDLAAVEVAHELRQLNLV